MAPKTAGLLALLVGIVGYRLLDRRLDERPSGLLTVAVAGLGAAAFLAFGSGAPGVEVLLSLALLGLVGVAQVVGSEVSVSTRAFGALALVAAAGMGALQLTVLDSSRSVAGAVLIGLFGLLCLLRPGAIERAERAIDGDGGE